MINSGRNGIREAPKTCGLPGVDQHDKSIVPAQKGTAWSRERR